MTGHLHPLTTTAELVVGYFKPLGFEIVLGPEAESEEYNFDKLRVFADHPARDEHDTFYLLDGRVLRTHTSNMQLRAMESRKPPVRLLSIGRCYRNEATDSGHNTTFHQVEALVIGEDITFQHLIGTLKEMMKHLIGESLEFRIRPGYFPFVEPGIELDFRKKGGQWQEILGAGMVHPEVLGNMKIDPKKYTGFAFGMGLERLLGVMTGIDDVRLPLSGDYRLLTQF
ncbi:MAG: phenylalanine--tRNA ligase subunit alpha [Candidatus Berkelbacteria bacterium]|nr:MAG: phenylalanine--tRNA ligase subunit alpha [Candidatus Berkelbacteria bacterium]QQG52126.1 MAG: phenylalanine--tRNA ligase subunit alpha [Candidatus Berkelbacteria bacterium]